MARNLAKASTQYLSIASAVVAAEPFSVSCWFTHTAAQTQDGTLFCVGTIGTSEHHALETTTAGTIRARTRNASGALSATTTGAFTDDTWTHAAGVWASSSSRAAYRDGANKGTDANNRAITSFDGTRIGVQTGGTLRYWDGLMAEMGFWGVALSDDEVALLAKGVSPLMVRPADLVAYWPLIGRFSPEIDLVGGNNMTLNGTPTQADHPRIFYPAAVRALDFAQPAGSSIGPIAAYHARRRAS